MFIYKSQRINDKTFSIDTLSKSFEIRNFYKHTHPPVKLNKMT